MSQIARQTWIIQPPKNDSNEFVLPPNIYVFALAASVYNKQAVMDEISESTKRSNSQIQSAVFLI